VKWLVDKFSGMAEVISVTVVARGRRSDHEISIGVLSRKKRGIKIVVSFCVVWPELARILQRSSNGGKWYSFNKPHYGVCSFEKKMNERKKHVVGERELKKKKKITCCFLCERNMWQ
jgi:hypothetical protein